MTNPELTRRELSLHERYSICRRNCGFPIPDTVLITYPSQALPSRRHLANRIDILLERIPLLGAKVCDSRTRTPYFSPRVPACTSNDVLLEDQSGNGGRDKVLELAISQIEKASEGAPLWQVNRYLPAVKDKDDILVETRDESNSAVEKAYLAISAQHELLDGQGLLRLAHALTCADISHISTEVFGTTPGMQGDEWKPSLRFLLPIIYRDMIVPSLPTWLSYYIRPTPSWPNVIKYDPHPSVSPWRFSITSIPSDIIRDVKCEAKKNGVDTIHPILKVAYLQAMRDTFSLLKSDVVFTGESPRSERLDSSHGHSYIAGNYVSGSSWTLPSTGGFWESCKTYSTYLHTTGISDGRQSMGLLAYLPDSPTFTSDDPKRATGWEDDYLTKFENGTIINGNSLSLSFSNLGRTALPPGAEDLVWGFPGSPFAPPLSVAVIGHERGIRVYTTWREGLVSRENVGQVERAFHEILQSHSGNKQR